MKQVSCRKDELIYRVYIAVNSGPWILALSLGVQHLALIR